MARRMTAWFVMLILASASPAQKLTEKESKEGFIPLFNGKDFSGWRFADSAAAPEKLPDNWKVEDGVIKLSGGGSPHLASQWDYEDFDVRFEWRGMVEGYNSGFYIRSGRAVGANQINLAQKDAGRLMQGGKGGKAVPELQKAVKEWNEWRALVVGDKVTFWCNGEKAWEATEFKTPRGYLGLQAEGRAMEFRNFRVKEIGYEALNDLVLWRGAGQWKIEDGVLVPDAKATTIESKKVDYKDFVLRLEWKAEKGATAGILLRGGAEDTGTVRFGDLPDGSGGIAAAGAKPAKKVDVPLGQWNYLEITVLKNVARVWLNGVVVADKVELKKAKASGDIRMQPEHAGMRFRNVRVREIAEDISKEEQAVIDLTNKEREKANLPALKPNATLFKVARAHSARMAEKDELAHELDGKDPRQRIKDAGYVYDWIGENVGWSTDEDPEAVMMGWLKSETHRDNLLKKEFTQIGIGIAKSQKGEYYYTQVFGTPKKK